MFKKLFEWISANVGPVSQRTNKDGKKFLAVFNASSDFDEAELNELCRQCGVEATLSNKRGYEPTLFIGKGCTLEDFEEFLS